MTLRVRKRLGDIHDYGERLGRALALAKEDLSRGEFGLVEDFVRSCLAEGVSAGRCARYVYCLRGIRAQLDVDFVDVDRRCVEDVMVRLNGMGYKPWTLQYYRVAFKKFYRWLRGAEETPPEVAWLSSAVKEGERILPEEVLTQEEVGRIAAAAENLRDRAFVETLYESGARIGEMLMLRIKNVEFDECGAVLIVRGKTGFRRVRVIEAAPRLQIWIENHPGERKPDSWLWVNIGTTNKGLRMDYHAVLKMLRVVATRARVAKRVNPHSFRHARATHCAKWMTEAQMCQYFGWKLGSKMPRVYVHLSGRDLDPTILAHYGLTKEEKVKPPLSPKRCPRCEALNSHDAKYCRRCSMILDPEEALRVEDQRHKLEKKVEELLKRLETLEGRNTVLSNSH